MEKLVGFGEHLKTWLPYLQVGTIDPNNSNFYSNFTAPESLSGNNALVFFDKERVINQKKFITNCELTYTLTMMINK